MLSCGHGTPRKLRFGVNDFNVGHAGPEWSRLDRRQQPYSSTAGMEHRAVFGPLPREAACLACGQTKTMLPIKSSSRVNGEPTQHKTGLLKKPVAPATLLTFARPNAKNHNARSTKRNVGRSPRRVSARLRHLKCSSALPASSRFPIRVRSNGEAVGYPLWMPHRASQSSGVRRPKSAASSPDASTKGKHARAARRFAASVRSPRSVFFVCCLPGYYRLPACLQ